MIFEEEKKKINNKGEDRIRRKRSVQVYDLLYNWKRKYRVEFNGG